MELLRVDVIGVHQKCEWGIERNWNRLWEVVVLKHYPGGSLHVYKLESCSYRLWVSSFVGKSGSFFFNQRIVRVKLISNIEKTVVDYAVIGTGTTRK